MNLFQIASLMGFTWIFGYIAAFTDVEALWYIYIILNSLQGVFIFVSFICNRRVGLLWIKKLRLYGLAEKEPNEVSTRDIGKSSPGTSAITQHGGSVHSVIEKGEGGKLRETKL